MASGNLVSVAELRPVPALITSIISFGSSPALTPMTIASEAIASDVAESRLLASFITCAMPGFSPITKTRPNIASSGFTRSSAAGSPDAMTASVPLLAPAMPPDTGASTMAMSLRASASATARVVGRPVVERSTRIFARLPAITPQSPIASPRTSSGSGRLKKMMSAASATAREERVWTAPRATSGATASSRMS